jgi:membrane-associated phospholipid phosphatase
MLKMKIKLIAIILGTIICHETSFSQNTDFPYKLSYSVDIPLATASITSKLISNGLDKNTKFEYLTNDRLAQLNPKNISKFDRSATHNWSPNLDAASSVTKDIVKWSPVIFFIPKIKNKKWKNFSILSVMYLEGFFLNKGLTNITKTATKRKRPFLYNNTTISTEKKENLAQKDNSYRSFYSGHTSVAFFSAVFASKIYTDIYGKSTMSYIVWGTTLSLATATGYLRYKSGWHFPTDIIVAAFAGSAIGYLIPALHKRKDLNNLSLFISSDHFSLTYNF